MMKKILSLFLAFMMLFSSAAITGKASAATDDTMSILVDLVKRFPNGKYWNHMGAGENDPDTVTDRPCSSHNRCDWHENACNCNSFDNAIQCMGYAHKISYEIVGEYPRRTYSKSNKLLASKLRVGDIIRYRNDSHSLCVTGVKGNRISFTDCNWIGRCQIRWGEMNLSEIKGFTYVLHHDSNNRTNTDLDFYKNISGSDYDVEEINHEVWRMKKNYNLNIRYDCSEDSERIGQISENTEFKVYDKVVDGKYLWGKVICGSVVGWSVLNYSTYIKGSIETPEISNLKKSYGTDKIFNLKWKSVSGADEYIIKLYDSNKKLKKTYSSDNNDSSLKISKEGKYYIKVCAVSKYAESWKCEGELKSFSIKDGHVSVKSLSLQKDSLTLSKGDTYVLNADILPLNATNKAVTYSSSDTKVATVDAKGRIKAKAFGEVKITCTSKENSALKAVCEIKVSPKKVTGIEQNYVSSSYVGIKWNKVSDAEYYYIYKYNGKTEEYEYVARTVKTEYRFKLKSDTAIYVKVRAVGKADLKNVYGAYSDKIKLYSGPSAPSLKATSGKGYAKLTWNKVQGATDYLVYRYIDGKYEKLDTVSSKVTSYTVKGLKKGKICYFKVRAVKSIKDFSAYGSYSARAQVKIK